MAFSEFRYPDVVAHFGLTEEPNRSLFEEVPPLQPSAGFRTVFSNSSALGAMAHSEAARSIWIVGPVLADLWSRYSDRINLLAGVEFNADPEAGLSGYVDFLLCRGPQRFTVSPPVLLIFEAKRDSIPDGLGQAIAGMVGTHRFNERQGQSIDPVYGCVTTGSLWRFLRLTGSSLAIDSREYSLAELERILGILSSVVGGLLGRAAA